MSIKIKMDTGWKVLQDVHDLGETLELWNNSIELDRCSHLMSDWEPIDRLTALQILFSETPYYGRELRYFNTAPWWYKKTFRINSSKGVINSLLFKSVDYYCKVWINGHYLGFHEGYFDSFEYDVTAYLKENESNCLIVKVWAPWDKEILNNAETMRCYSVKREMIKGTYEHADGFIQRDVNPVGITGPVCLKQSQFGILKDDCFINPTYLLIKDRADLKINGEVIGTNDNCFIDCRVIDEMGKTIVRKQQRLNNSSYNLSLGFQSPVLWNVWERGQQYLYTVVIELVDAYSCCVDRIVKKVGFREIKLERTESRNRFSINGNPIFLRGTSYFADVYNSEMTWNRYYKDLRLIKDAGFNAIRVHVHVEQDSFYSICDELGLLVIQDSDFNWDHPTTSEWKRKAKHVFGRMIDILKMHASIICWIVLNEPDVWKLFTGGLLEQTSSDDIMLETLCKDLLSCLTKKDNTRPYIKASREENDPDSGDSHTYTGSLATGTNYEEIRDTKEKLNTEFGMDIPSIEQSLFHDKRVFNKLLPIIPKLDELQEYQYRLLKFYIEHYRMQKYNPCSGFFQFMFIDLCPQSFYGVFDYYGLPKKGYKAILESGQPLGLFVEKSVAGFDIILVNDLLKTFAGVVSYSINKDNRSVLSGSQKVVVERDSIRKVIAVCYADSDDYDIQLYFVSDEGEMLITNHYKNVFKELPHIKGHSMEICNELGMRLFMEKSHEN